MQLKSELKTSIRPLKPMRLRFLPIRSAAEPPNRGELHGKPHPAGSRSDSGPVPKSTVGQEAGFDGGLGRETRNSVRESAAFPQQSVENGVPEDMASLVIDNPALSSAMHAGRGSGIGLGNSRPSSLDSAVNGGRGQSGAGQSDAEIMLAVAAGDEAGYNYLVTKYHRQIIHFLFRMVHNEAVAEELAQEVFLRVYRSRESYRAEAKFSTWLYRIATNLAVNHARDTKYERTAQTVELDAPDAESGSMPEVADDNPNIEQRMLREERMAAIRAQVAALPERQRMAVLMHKYQEMDYRQIGEVLKLSESATKSLLFRAYQTLRERLKEFV
jgi:RNA polymerase sigma-70 factor (ECF subfamily)